ncbi:hypothetical protein AVEN_29309-1 [Araneus ventricosus]|uniref:Uncharacterized protein n=1 Tax=Araneus ventricosus TaxID=182803 RepID=A0A4Y2UCH0_ARAVE|nr:hypothetical protein AVEN_29309-1 [Araneus ventricosus]
MSSGVARVPRVNLSRATPSLPCFRGHLKNDRRSSCDTEVRVLTTITGLSSRRYISLSVRVTQPPPLLYQNPGAESRLPMRGLLIHLLMVHPGGIAFEGSRRPTTPP